MNNPNFIFNPYLQQFVPVYSENGQQIVYLEKICFECGEDSVYDQIQLKCIKKKNYKSLEKQQIELCKNYIQLKKNIAPIDRSLLYKILNIRILNKSISEILDINSNNINLFNDKQINIAIVSILAYLVNNHLQLSKIGILESIFQQIYKILGHRQDILNFMFKITENIINNYPKIVALPFKQIAFILGKVFSLLKDTKYLFLYTFNNCIYFILGCVEYSVTKVFSKEISEKIMDGRVLDTIKLILAKENQIQEAIILTNSFMESQKDIYDSIPNWKYHTSQGLLYPIFEEKDTTAGRKIEYHKKNLSKNKEEVKINLESLKNFTTILTVDDINLLKKLGHMDDSNRLYLERIGLGHLKDPSKQLLGLRYFENSEKDNSFYYIDNSGNERYKSIYATAQAPKIDQLLLKYFKKEIVPKYKIYSKEVEILENLLNKTIEYNKEKVRIDLLIAGITEDVKGYNQKRQKLLNQLNQIKKETDKKILVEKINEIRKNIKMKLDDKKRIINKFKNSELFLKVKRQDTEVIKKIQNKIINLKKLLKEEHLKKTERNDDLIKNIVLQIKDLSKNLKKQLNKTTLKPKIIDLDDKSEKELRYIINILKKQIQNIDLVIDSYSSVFNEQGSEIINRLINDNKHFFDKIDLNTKNYQDRYSKLLEQKNDPSIKIPTSQVNNVISQTRKQINQAQKQIENMSSQKQIKLIDPNVIFNELLLENNIIPKE